MKRHLILVLLASLLASCSFPSLQNQASATATQQAKAENEEYAVYSALITERYISPGLQIIVIHDHTGLDYEFIDLDARLKYVQENIPQLTPEIVADFKLKNVQPLPLKSQFSLNVSYLLMSDKEWREIFTDQDAWKYFYQLYPHSQGVMTLSRVGFNSDLDMALVYVGNSSGFLAGAGYYVLMVKENGLWEDVAEIMVWIS